MHLIENRDLKILRGRIQKNFNDLNQAWNSDWKYTHLLQN